MKEPTLKRAAAISLMLHMAFFSIALVTVKKPRGLIMPPPYFVTLLGPSQMAGQGHAPESEKTVMVAPPPSGIEAAPDISRYKAERIKDIKAKQEETEYKSDRLSAIRAKKKLKQSAGGKRDTAGVEIKYRGSQGRGAQEGKAAGGQANNYYSLVSDRIWQEWVFAGAEAAGLEAVISITVMRDGTIVINGFEKTSGNTLFDRSALKAVNRASPLQPPPPFELELGVRFTP